MRKTTTLFAALAMVSLLLCGCKENVDLAKIDKKFEAKLGLALPVGTMRFTIGDFLGNGEVQQLYINEQGILSYRDTFSVNRPFHDIDLSQYLGDTTARFDVYDKIQSPVIPGDGNAYGIDFPMTLAMKGINQGITADSNERIDSAIITMAKFTSNITSNGLTYYESGSYLPLKWDWIDRIEIVLGDEFSRPSGQTLVVYDKVENAKKPASEQINDWGKDIEIDVNEFTMCLMKDKIGAGMKKDLNWYIKNAKNTCNFTFKFTIRVPNGKNVFVDQQASFDYQFKVNFVDYYALWGYFKPGNKMEDEQEINIADEWPNWKYFANAVVPFTDPTVQLLVTTQLSAALYFCGDYLYAKDSPTGTPVYATFNNAGKKERIELRNGVEMSSPVGESVTIRDIIFSKDQGEGHIDNMFRIKPAYLGYKYHITLNTDIEMGGSPQIRINKGGTDLYLQAVANLPFQFNEGLDIDYQDTIKDVNISSWSLDSLLAETKVVDTVKSSNLKLVLTARNTLPMRIKGSPQFLDEAGKVIMDPSNPSEPLRFGNDTLVFNAPTKYEQTSTGTYIEPGITTFTLLIDKQHFDQFAKIKQIKMRAIADNATMVKGVDAPVTKDSSLKLKIGIAGNIDAIINLEKSNQ